MTYTDTDGVTRHASVLEAPDEAILCWGYGHQWEPDFPETRPGFGTIVDVVRTPCRRGCDRVRVDTHHQPSYERLARSYHGGHGLLARERVLVDEAKQEWARRVRAKAAGVVTLAEQRRRRRA